jgi:hypothetical protein
MKAVQGHTKHVNALFGQNTEYWMLNMVVYEVIKTWYIKRDRWLQYMHNQTSLIKCGE